MPSQRPQSRQRRPVVVADASEPRPIPLWGLAGAGFALFAVGLELVSSAYANSPVPRWAELLAPLGWPPAGRVVWWLVVAGAVGTFHAGARAAGSPRHPVVVVATVLPFVAFAIGIGFGAQWATWH